MHLVFCNHHYCSTYSVDDITIPSVRGNGVLRRVPEVFDCWFESGRYVHVMRGAGWGGVGKRMDEEAEWRGGGGHEETLASSLLRIAQDCHQVSREFQIFLCEDHHSSTT